MATRDMSILGASTSPDNSGDVFPEPLEQALTLGTATFGNTLGFTMLAPTGSDIGLYGKFTVPQDYVGTPVMAIKGVVAEGANILGFGCQQVAIADDESVDQAYEAEDIASETVTHTAEDVYEQTITLTPGAAYQPGDEVFFFLYRDDSVDTQTGEFHLTGLFFRYSDA